MRRGRRHEWGADIRLLARGPRHFVLFVFSILAASFVLSTVALVREFPQDWPILLATHSHRFFFYPVLGIAALACFYVPAVVLTHLYWREDQILRYGRGRFVLGFLVVAAGSLGLAASYAGIPLTFGQRAPTPAMADRDTEFRRSIWELSPAALARNTADGAVVVPGCRTFRGEACRRVPVLEALYGLRKAAEDRWTITEFARVCVPDEFVEKPAAYWVERRCFAGVGALNAPDCCKVQRSLAAEVARLAQEDGMASRVGLIENVVTIAKAFFVLVVVAVGLMLAIWRNKLLIHYRGHLDAVERGVIVGATLMLVWLLMDYGYQQSVDVLFGRLDRHFPLRGSLAVGVLAVALIIYFLNRSVFNFAQLTTIGASAVAVANYELIGNTAARLLGAGAPYWVFGLLVAAAIVAVLTVYSPWKVALPPRREPPPYS